mgnify:FL=1
MKTEEFIAVFLSSIAIIIFLRFLVEQGKEEVNTEKIELEYIITQECDTAWGIYTTRTSKHYTLTKPSYGN